MPLTRDFKDTIKARAERDPAFRVALLEEALDAFLNADLETGKLLLRDYVNATVGFETLGIQLHKSPESLMHMLQAHKVGGLQATTATDSDQWVTPEMLLMIDNYDSFTYNLVQYLGELGVEVRVFRNDGIDLEKIADLAPTHIVISPGPCAPDQAGISVPLIRAFAGRVPILGVCLGHQSIGQAFGGSIVKARQVMHGKTSLIHHEGQGVFAGLEMPFQATRYHSLVVAEADLPRSLEITAWTRKEDGTPDEIMGIRHRGHPVQGVQFHPESILTRQGHDLLRNFIDGSTLSHSA